MLTPLDIRKVRCLDGLHYSFQILRFYYSTLWEICCSIPEDNLKITPALAACWGIIDVLHRIREIAQSLPGLSTKHAEMRAFLGGSALAEEYRHYIQHLRGELANTSSNGFPVWGSLAWVDPHVFNRSHIVQLGTALEGVSYSGCVFDTIEHRWVSKVSLSIGNTSFNFDPILESTFRFEAFIMPYLVDHASEFVHFHDKLTIISTDVFLRDHS